MKNQTTQKPPMTTKKKSALLLAAGVLLMGSSFGGHAALPKCTSLPGTLPKVYMTYTGPNPVSVPLRDSSLVPIATGDLTPSGALVTNPPCYYGGRWTLPAMPLIREPNITPGRYYAPVGKGLMISPRQDIWSVGNLSHGFIPSGLSMVTPKDFFTDDGKVLFTNPWRFFIYRRIGYLPESGVILPAGSRITTLFIEDGAVTGDVVEFVLANTIYYQMVVNTCTVHTPVITVNLPAVNQNDLNAVGKTSRDQRFSMDFSCEDHGTINRPNIALSFDGDMVDKKNGVFKNTNSETEANVGIQILDRQGKPVNTESDNNIELGSIYGDISYPMTARYYALSAEQKMGPVKAVAYITINYN